MSSREIMNGMDGKMDKNKQNSPRTIMFRDPVVENVVDKFVDRSNIGYAKYISAFKKVIPTDSDSSPLPSSQSVSATTQTCSTSLLSFISAK